MEALARARVLLARQDEIGLAYLFGSRADGTAVAESDYDIAVLASPPLTWARRCELTHALSRELGGQAVDLVLLDHAPIELAYAVIATGVRLVARDEASRVEFEAGVLSRYGDHLPVLRAQRDDVLARRGHEAGVRRYRAALAAFAAVHPEAGGPRRPSSC